MFFVPNALAGSPQTLEMIADQILRQEEPRIEEFEKAVNHAFRFLSAVSNGLGDRKYKTRAISMFTPGFRSALADLEAEYGLTAEYVGTVWKVKETVDITEALTGQAADYGFRRDYVDNDVMGHLAEACFSH